MTTEQYAGACDRCGRISSLRLVEEKFLCWRCIELDAAPEIEQQPSAVATVHAPAAKARS
jgi:hypothetical protein